MIDPQQWMSDAVTNLKEKFGSRLVYVGLQGSYQRGEATENSDIDLVTILDRVSLADLDAHRAATRAVLAEGDKTCGFICGADEFAHWPRHELFPFKMDTTDYYGRLEDFMPTVERADIALGVRISASMLLHMLRHTWLYGDPANHPPFLAEVYKAAFFMLRVAAYLKSGQYHSSKKSLAEALSGPEQEIVQAGRDFMNWSKDRSPAFMFELLIERCRELMNCEC